MAGIDGIMITYYIKQIYPHIKMIARTDHRSAEAVRQCIYGGADGFLVKTAVEDELPRAIRDIRNGELYIDGNSGFSDIQVRDLADFRKKIMQGGPAQTDQTGKGVSDPECHALSQLQTDRQPDVRDAQYSPHLF